MQKDFSKIVEPFIEKYKNLDKTLLNTILSLSSGDVDINELDQEKTKLEEELLEKYERQEYLEDIAKKIEEYNNNK